MLKAATATFIDFCYRLLFQCNNNFNHYFFYFLGYKKLSLGVLIVF
jgi:hypothetical protein